MWGQCVTIYHGWKMTLTASQGKLLLRGSHLDQYTMNFFPGKKSNYTTETSKSIPSQANTVSTIETWGYGLVSHHPSLPIKSKLNLFFVMLILSFSVIVNPHHWFLVSRRVSLVSVYCFYGKKACHASFDYAVRYQSGNDSPRTIF